MKKYLHKLMALVVVSLFTMGAWAQTWTSSEVGEGTFYLYNVGAQKFLCSGNNYGSHASVAEGGVPVTLAGSDNVYTISTAAIYSGKFLNGEYMDGGTYDWTFEEVSAGVYNLKNGDNVLYWNGGTSTNTTLGADPGTAASQWMLVTEEARVAALADATQDSPIDATFLIKNAYFAKGNGHYFVRTSNYNSLSTSTSWKGSDLTDFWGYDVASEEACYAVEQYGKTFDNYQELTVPNGKYFMTAKGFYRNNGGNKAVPYIYANSEKCELKSKGELKKGDGTVSDGIESGAIALRGDDYLLDGVTVVVTDGSLRVGVKSDADIDWCVFDDFKLIYLGGIDLSEVVAVYEAALAKAQEAAGKTDKMEIALMTALNNAISIYGSVDETNQSALEEAISALNAAADNVNASIAAYAGAAAYLEKMGAVLENTNVYTQEAYDAYYGDWLVGYEAGTLETATAATLNANTALGTGWRSSNNIDDILLSAWTIGGEQANNYDLALYVNTWSTEGDTDGSEFFTPFFEYWTADANSLSAETMTATMEGLAPGQLYSLEAWVRVSAKEGVAAADATGITLSVGEGEPVDITEGEAIDGTRRSHAVFTAYGYADAEGKLTINFNVLEGNNVSWLSFKNLKYAEAEMATEEQQQAFAAAIAEAETHTLGFAVGEYAPYTNVEALKALAEAKAIALNSPYVVLKEVQEALEAAVWTANAEEMNAIYDGSFEYDYSAIEGNVKPLGWNRTSGANTGYEVRYITNVPEGATSSNKGMFIKFTADYGRDAGYTMPLKAKSAYALSFVYTGWGNKPTVGIVIEDEAGNAVEITPASITATADGQQDAANWQTYKGVFTTGDADANYILYFEKSETNQLQIAFGDFRLYTVVEVATVTLNKETIELKKGATEQLIAAVAPADATFQELAWESDDKAVADVDENGLVTAVAAGSATITATSVNGVKAECTVVVSDVDTDIQTITTNTDAVIYDLSGRRVEKAVKGIYIVNGKKVVK